MSKKFRRILRNVTAIFTTFNLITLVTVTLIALVQTAFGGSFEDHMKRHMAFIFSLFGLKGEDVITTNVQDVQLLPQEDWYNDLTTQLALIHQDTQLNIIDILKNMTMGILGKYNSYHEFGKSYVKGYPDCSIKVDAFPTEATKVVIETIYGVPIDILSTKLEIPVKEEFCYWWLKENYGLVLSTLTFTYTGLPYVVQTMDYNYGTNNYDIVATNAGTPITLSVLAPTSTTHLIVKWKVVGGVAENWWVYKKGSGTYPNLDARYETTDLGIMPILQIRSNGVNIATNPTGVEYLPVKEALATIGVDIDAISTSINESPTAGDTLDAFVYFGLNIADTDPVVSKMMYKIFEYVFKDVIPGTNSIESEFGNENNVNQYRITFKEGNYNTAVAWAYQKFNIREGIIGPIGTYTTTVSGSTLILKSQLSEEQYGEYQMAEIFTVTSILRGGLIGTVTSTLLAGTMVMPLSYNLIEEFSPVEQMLLFNKSLRLSLYAAQVTHLNWYQTAEFQVAVQVIMVVIAIVIMFAGGGPKGAKAWLMFAGKMLLMLGASYGLKKILESNADGWIKILATIAYAALAYSMGNAKDGNMFMTSDQISAAVTNFSSNFAIGANEVFGALKMGTEAWNMQTEKKMQALIDESTAYGQKAEEVFNTIEGRMALLEEGLSTAFVETLANMDTSEPFIKGPDASYYAAIQMQHDHVELAISRPYESMFDYDKYYKLGVV